MARTFKDYPSVALKAEDLDGKIDFAHIFGRSGAVHIEIGTGKVAFLLNEAKAEPGANFFGIERARRYYRILPLRRGPYRPMGHDECEDNAHRRRALFNRVRTGQLGGFFPYLFPGSVAEKTSS
jgi:hypothetical protein